MNILYHVWLIMKIKFVSATQITIFKVHCESLKCLSQFKLQVCVCIRVCRSCIYVVHPGSSYRPNNLLHNLALPDKTLASISLSKDTSQKPSPWGGLYLLLISEKIKKCPALMVRDTDARLPDGLSAITAPTVIIVVSNHKLC